MTRLLRYRAGPAAMRTLKEHGLTADRIGALVGPASGPKWLVLSGLDHALIDLDLLGSESRRSLLVGSSAGGWRILALASSDPRATLHGLTAGYVHQVFTREDTPITVSRAYREMFEELFSESDIEHVLNHPRFDVALHVVRCRGWKSKGRAAQWPRLIGAAAAQCVSKRGSQLFFERILLHSRPGTDHPIDGRCLPLDRRNFFDAAMATGTVPLYMDPIRDLGDASPGPYMDGGLVDYHLNQRYVADDQSVVIFPHYRERIAPGWFDKHLPFRRPSTEMLDNVLQIFPSRTFVDRLPGGTLPDRQDFTTFVDDSSQRIRRWQEAVRLSQELGAELRDDVESGRLVDLLEPI